MDIYDIDNMHLNLFLNLLKYAKDSTFKKIYDFLCRNFDEIKYDETISDYRFYLFWLLTCDEKYYKNNDDLKFEANMLINLLKTIYFIIDHILYYVIDDSNYDYTKKDTYSTNFEKIDHKILCKYIEIIVDSIHKYNLLITWCNDESNLVLIYFSINELKERYYRPENFGSDIDIIFNINKNKLYLQNKQEIYHMKQIPSKIGIKKFKTVYNSFSEALIALNRKSYCPWCNPNDLLKSSAKSRPRLKDDCVFIKNFILENLGGYNEKYLNNEITKIKVKDNLEDTIRKRGVKLLKYLELISKKELENPDIQFKYNKCIELIKSKYNV